MILINGSTFVIVVKTKKLKPKTKSQDIVCYVRFSGLFLSIYGTAFTVTLIALDRATAISAPHTYRVMVSTTVMALTVAAVWGLSALMVVISLVAALFILYAIIGWKMKKRLAQVGVDPSQNGPSRRGLNAPPA
nr:hypothetical protein BaRGS_009811 [Batillaria attramentaria]